MRAVLGVTYYSIVLVSFSWLPEWLASDVLTSSAPFPYNLLFVHCSTALLYLVTIVLSTSRFK